MKATGKQKWWVWQEKIWKKRGFWFWVVIFYRSIEAVAVRSYRPDNGGILSSLTDEKNQMGQCLREEEEKNKTPVYHLTTSTTTTTENKQLKKKKKIQCVCIRRTRFTVYIFPLGSTKTFSTCTRVKRPYRKSTLGWPSWFSTPECVCVCVTALQFFAIERGIIKQGPPKTL